MAGLAGRDRRLAHALAAGVLRRRADLDRQLDLRHADRRLHDILRLGLFQLRDLARVPAYAAVATSVDLAREAAGAPAARYVNATLRRLATGEPRQAPGGSHPAWLERRWRRRYGPDDTRALLAWNDAPRPLVVQPARWTTRELADQLRAAGLRVDDAPFGAGFVVTDAAGRPPRPATLPGFAAGGFVVQDAGPALVCRFAAIAAGALTYDPCAAPGGKAAALARGGARVIAGELRRERLPRLRETLGRTGPAPVVLADLRASPFAPAAFDAVLLDAPCTATGVIARHPDARWRLSERAIARAAALQHELVDAAAELVRPGGVLVYATCSLEPEENEEVIQALLARRPDLSRAPVPEAVPADLLTAAGDLAVLPQRHGADGAYAARLVRAA